MSNVQQDVLWSLQGLLRWRSGAFRGSYLGPYLVRQLGVPGGWRPGGTFALQMVRLLDVNLDGRRLKGKDIPVISGYRMDNIRCSAHF